MQEQKVIKPKTFSEYLLRTRYNFYQGCEWAFFDSCSF